MDEKDLKERFEEELEAAGFVIDWDRLKEVVEELEKAFAAIGLMAQDAIKALSATYEEIEEAFSGIENRARRRKMERSRAQAIEQRYRAEIHRVERERFCRRIYKPP